MSNVFISYLRENSDNAQQLYNELRKNHVKVFTRDTILPGSRKRTATRRAIDEASFFIACFSKAYHVTGKTEMNVELNLAIDQLRQLRHDQSWFIPVKLDECEVPDIDIGGASETLRDFGGVNLYDNWEAGVQQILSVIQPSQIADDDNAEADFDGAFISDLKAPDRRSLREWLGADRAMLAIAFTDVVGSTELANQLGNEAMNTVRGDHFKQGRHLIEKYNGYEVKTIGDAFMVAFRTAVDALDFALVFHASTGNEQVKIRVGIHVGSAHIEEGDTFGLMVNYTARVENMANGAEIWMSSRAKLDVDDERAQRHESLEWKKHTDCELKGFGEQHTLWSLFASESKNEDRESKQRETRVQATPAPPQAQSQTLDRERLITDLRALPGPLFNALVLTLKPPNGVVSSPSAPQANRVFELIGWAEGPGGCRLPRVEEVLKAIINPR